MTTKYSPPPCYSTTITIQPDGGGQAALEHLQELVSACKLFIACSLSKSGLAKGKQSPELPGPYTLDQQLGLVRGPTSGPRARGKESGERVEGWTRQAAGSVGARMCQSPSQLARSCLGSEASAAVSRLRSRSRERERERERRQTPAARSADASTSAALLDPLLCSCASTTSLGAGRSGSTRLAGAAPAPGGGPVCPSRHRDPAARRKRQRQKPPPAHEHRSIRWTSVAPSAAAPASPSSRLIIPTSALPNGRWPPLTPPPIRLRPDVHCLHRSPGMHLCWYHIR
ncbi:hypothetical protein B2J93_8375 [Marssonina coronariae]|uniref:Uncharacterized protein n=1 Tax=Diplocarpon coronariae TaxID=2795749 RepID=A0A218ZCF6_9HELO|nr:hypothetical protein B2J93_8375 [Marssonina coronariae]